MREHTREELDADIEAQNECYDKTRANWLSPANQPCEICGKEHRNYECCEKCNRDRHTCHFCGDSLGHEEISACYRQIAREEAWEKENTEPVHAQRNGFEVRLCNPAIEEPHQWNSAGTHFITRPAITCGDCVEILKKQGQLT